jgi:hypothetical protein
MGSLGNFSYGMASGFVLAIFAVIAFSHEPDWRQRVEDRDRHIDQLQERTKVLGDQVHYCRGRVDTLNTILTRESAITEHILYWENER